MKGVVGEGGGGGGGRAGNRNVCSVSRTRYSNGVELTSVMAVVVVFRDECMIQENCTWYLAANGMHARSSSCLVALLKNHAHSARAHTNIHTHTNTRARAHAYTHTHIHTIFDKETPAVICSCWQLANFGAGSPANVAPPKNQTVSEGGRRRRWVVFRRSPSRLRERERTFQTSQGQTVSGAYSRHQIPRGDPGETGLPQFACRV